VKRLLILCVFLISILGCTSTATDVVQKRQIPERTEGRELIIDSTSLSDIRLFPSLQVSKIAVLIVSVNPNGIIKSVSIEESTGYKSMDDELVKAVSLWRFASTPSHDYTVHRISFSIVNGGIKSYSVRQMNE
jgi:TonB family protein